MRQCPICKKTFTDQAGVYSHAQAKHKKHHTEHLHPRHFRDHEPSVASRMIDAQLQRAMGGPVDEDYLLDWMD